jgi:nitrogen-specific signal transduction histidine kinase
VVGLAGVAAIFVAQALTATLWRAHADAEARRIADESVASVDLVRRIGHDLDQQRVIVDEHISESDPDAMREAEARLATVSTDLRRAIDAFGPMIDLPGERMTWQHALEDMQRFRNAIDRALPLSRQNLNAEASAIMMGVGNDFADLERAVDELVEINHDQVRSAADRQAALERSAAIVVIACQLAGLAGLVWIGWWGFRRVAREEQRAAEVRMLDLRNRELDAFAGRVAHDLRNPLSSILFTIDQLALTTEPEDESLIDRVRRGSRRIEAIIDDLLALSRIDAEKRIEACNPAAVIAKLGKDFDERFGEDAKLHVDVETGRVPYGEGLLQQAIWNLVENGVKYRRRGVTPEIKVSGRASGEGYVLRVVDNGIGMSAEEASRAFDPFYRADHARTIGGTGLGLTIVKRVVEAQGGAVSIERSSEPGTTFVLALPLTITARAARAPRSPS